MSDFEVFWLDPRIPKRMKRCGPAPVRAALAKRPDKDELEERILASLPGYECNKADYADYCMLSTYINAERDKVDWDEMQDRPNTLAEQQQAQHEARVRMYRNNGYWNEYWGPKPGLRVVSNE